ncbi:MAG TPA: hypothetical protein ENK43_15650 [Planctomycetes bacterium]|nr:hypothetical protein [Planctomycetota bacterium]
MSENPRIAKEIQKLEARINEIEARPTYSSTPAWQQEVAEMRLQIEALRSGEDVERAEYRRVEIPEGGAAHAAVSVDASGAAVLDPEALIEHELHGEQHADYTAIWFVLAIMTLFEWKLSAWFKVEGLSLWMALSVMAVVKAALVALYFMHLKFEKRTIFAILVLPFVLALCLFFLVSPDAQQHVWDWFDVGRG